MSQAPYNVLPHNVQFLLAQQGILKSLDLIFLANEMGQLHLFFLLNSFVTLNLFKLIEIMLTGLKKNAEREFKLNLMGQKLESFFFHTKRQQEHFTYPVHKRLYYKG